MLSLNLKFGSIISFFVVFYAFYQRSDHLNVRIHSIRKELLNLETLNSVSTGLDQPKVAVGFGACHDIFVNATEFLDYANFKGPPEPIDEITNEEQFLKSFAYYFKHGAAAERFIYNTEFFDELVSQAKQLEHSRWNLGGNAPLMARRFHIEGWSVLLSAKMSQNLKSYIPEGIAIAGNEEVKDDVHMIMEYKADAQWGPFTAPRANRYILHNDESNPLVSSLLSLEEKIFGFAPDLFVVSGLQMMDNYPFKQGVRESKLKAIKELILRQPKETLIHFEMASYVELELLKHLMEHITPHTDSVGMNEQELDNLYHILQYGNVSLIADSNPRIATALDQMRQVFTLIRASSKKIGSKNLLTRIHVHTLAYQAIMTVKQSRWIRTKAAAAKASLTAHRYVCNTDNVHIEKAKVLLDDSFSTTTARVESRIFLDPEQPVSCWDEVVDGVEVDLCVAPVLICTEAQLTAGAGDNISAAGLVLQL